MENDSEIEKKGDNKRQGVFSVGEKVAKNMIETKREMKSKVAKIEKTINRQKYRGTRERKRGANSRKGSRRGRERFKEKGDTMRIKKAERKKDR